MRKRARAVEGVASSSAHPAKLTGAGLRPCYIRQKRSQERRDGNRALILEAADPSASPGVGLAAGLEEGGVKIAAADRIVGTSAGSFAGARWYRPQRRGAGAGPVEQAQRDWRPAKPGRRRTPRCARSWPLLKFSSRAAHGGEPPPGPARRDRRAFGPRRQARLPVKEQFVVGASADRSYYEARRSRRLCLHASIRGTASSRRVEAGLRWRARSAALSPELLGNPGDRPRRLTPAAAGGSTAECAQRARLISARVTCRVRIGRVISVAAPTSCARRVDAPKSRALRATGAKVADRPERALPRSRPHT